ncbi:TIGR03899 family protein [Photobacterium minamisatsumaniensis]|uniref:TIGR03899 family protein n=1 Tax=Photobacterium minamisatsumaniensis TaxID=2910233 RepID=UPI003D12626A
MSNDQTDLPTIELVSKLPKVGEKIKSNGSACNYIEKIAIEYGVNYLINPKDESNLHQRSKERLENDNNRQQENLEKIFKLTSDNYKTIKTAKIDPDWLFHFISIAKNIRNHSMQHLWARTLKQELTISNSVSLKTLDTLRNMTHKEAQIFHRASMLSCQISNDSCKKLVTSLKIKPFLLPRLFSTKIKKLNLGYFQLPYSDVLILMDLGLLIKTELESGSLEPKVSFPFRYQQYTYNLTPIQKEVSFTYYRFSPVGEELAELLGEKTNEPFRESILELINTYFIVEAN